MRNSDALIDRALGMAGMTLPQTAPFFRQAQRQSIWLTGKALRTTGRLLTPVEKKEAGVRTRGQISAEFFCTLNDKGRADPVEAADRIAVIINKTTHSAAELRNVVPALSGNPNVRFFPSNIAFGPCPAAAQKSRRLFMPESAPLLPLAECTHPSQCGCRYLNPDFTWD